MTDTVYASGRKYGNMTVIFRKQQIEGEQNTFFKVTKKKQVNLMYMQQYLPLNLTYFEKPLEFTEDKTQVDIINNLYGYHFFDIKYFITATR